MTVYDELVARGLIAQVTDEEEIKELINNGKATFYIGFDPTADSLHVCLLYTSPDHIPAVHNLLFSILQLLLNFSFPASYVTTLLIETLPDTIQISNTECTVIQAIPRHRFFIPDHPSVIRAYWSVKSCIIQCFHNGIHIQ